MSPLCLYQSLIHNQGALSQLPPDQAGWLRLPAAQDLRSAQAQLSASAAAHCRGRVTDHTVNAGPA